MSLPVSSIKPQKRDPSGPNVVVTCRVMKVARQPYGRWVAAPCDRRHMGRGASGDGSSAISASSPADVGPSPSTRWSPSITAGRRRSGNHSAVIALDERASRFLLLAPLGAERDAVRTLAELMVMFGHLSPELLKSLAWGQGDEMSEHAALTAATGMPIYFCNSVSPWQRGSNEKIYWYKRAEPEATSAGVALARATRCGFVVPGPLPPNRSDGASQ